MSYTTNYTMEDYDYVMNLRKSGLGVQRIVQELHKIGKRVNSSTVGRWIYKNGKIFQETIISPLKEDSQILSEEKAYILGAL